MIFLSHCDMISDLDYSWDHCWPKIKKASDAQSCPKSPTWIMTTKILTYLVFLLPDLVVFLPCFPYPNSFAGSNWTDQPFCTLVEFLPGLPQPFYKCTERMRTIEFSQHWLCSSPNYWCCSWKRIETKKFCNKFEWAALLWSALAPAA